MPIDPPAADAGHAPMTEDVATNTAVTSPEQLETCLPEPVLTKLLLSISKTTRALMGIRLAELGFTLGQDELIIVLDEKIAMNIAALADRLGVRPTTVSKMVHRLLLAGLVEQQVSKVDSRNTLITLTPLGLDWRTRFLAMHAKLEQEIFRKLSKEEVAELNLQLSVAKDLLDTVLADLR